MKSAVLTFKAGKPAFKVAPQRSIAPAVLGQSPLRSRSKRDNTVWRVVVGVLTLCFKLFVKLP